jgi:hypothetical protein
MISVSPGIALGSFDLLRLIEESQLTIPQIVGSFSHFSGIRSEEIVSFAQRTGWVQVSEAGVATPTPKGARLIALRGYEVRLRQALLDHIDASDPPWVQCATYGRSRVMSFAGSGVAQVIVEAGLANGYSEDVVEFWDSLAARARGMRDASLAEIGRRGERLTIAHEEARTGQKPKWIAINNNADGYDVLSVVDADDSRSLSIEVKTSTQGTSGSLWLTRNEWEMAQERMSHVFHLWDIGSAPPLLAKASVEDMARHVPSDMGCGHWDVVVIPFKAFGAMLKAQPDLA